MAESLFISNSLILLYGFIIGLKHATDADHLAAIGTIVAEKKGIVNSALIGGLWGLGHTFSLTLAGLFVLFLNFQISERAENIFELCVGIMLLFLGLNVFRKILLSEKFHFHVHSHGEHSHAHPHIHHEQEKDSVHTHHGLNLSPRSFFIGLVHGLAGSAGLMLIVIPTINSKLLGMLYILVFGIGSIGGMMLMSLIISLPFTLSSNMLRLNKILQALAGTFSILLGLYIIYEKGFSETL
jgi:high-affinity nickel permease